MTESMTKTGTTLTEELDAKRAQEKEIEVIPPPPVLPAEVLPPAPGEALLSLSLSLSEIGCIAASLQTAVHSGWIKQATHVNTVNSVLRKFHDAKVQYVKEHPE